MEDISTLNIILTALPIYAMIVAGWLLRKFNWIEPKADGSLLKIAVEFTLPCFILVNILDNKLLESIPFSLLSISLGAGGILICIPITWLFAKLLRLKIGKGLRTFMITTSVQNYGLFLVALMAIIFKDSDILGVAITHNVGCDLVFWTLGFLMLSNVSKISFSFLLRGPILGVLIGLICVWTGLSAYVPNVIKTFLKLMGDCAIPLNLMIFGTIIFDMLGKEKLNWRLISTAVLLRMGILPLVLIFFAVILPIDMSLKTIIIFQAVAPCGITSAILAKHFCGYPQIAVQIILATCFVSILTIPFWLSFGMSLIK